jgi:hypothetical protein
VTSQDTDTSNASRLPEDAAKVPEDTDAQICARLVLLLRESVGEDRRWPSALGPRTRLDADLMLDSLELAAFAAELRAHFGDQVDLLRFIAGLDLDAIIALTIADVAAYVARRATLPPGQVPERVTDRVGSR